MQTHVVLQIGYRQVLVQDYQQSAISNADERMQALSASISVSRY